ncbi:hypothetical protein [Gracilibacillus timonensis]|nr:hypothetical protein [Gracilibacillus timonensis]
MSSRKQKKKQERQSDRVATANHLTIIVSVVANSIKTVYYFIKTLLL